MTIELHQFPYSHYNEKARWALDYKGVPHVRRSYLPGPHMAQIRRLSGQPQTPVLVWDGEVIAGSGAIIDALEARVPDPPLLPEGAEERERIAELRRYFDEEVGPAVRTALFSVLIEQPGYIARMFAGGQPLLKRAGYRAMLPLVKGLIAKGNGVTDPANVVRSFEVTAAALDRVAELSAATGQLVGGHFTAADLTAAALLAPLVSPDHPDMKKPEPVPAPIQAFAERFADHAGARWVLDQYRRHRPG